MLSKLKKNEQGNVLIIFALSFTVLMLFLSLATDVAGMYVEQDNMTEIAHMMRGARFTKGQNTSAAWINQENPGEYFADLLASYARANGFKGRIKVVFNERVSEINRREADIDFTLYQQYPTTALQFFGIREVPISVHIHGYEIYRGRNLWYPVYNRNYRYYRKIFPAISE